MEYITIENDIVIGHFYGKQPEKKEGIEYRKAENYIGGTGININMLDKSLKIKPMEILIKEGWVEIPEGKKFDKDKGYFVDLNQREKIEAGLVNLKPEEKIDGDYIVLKSKEELYQEGLISTEEYNIYIDELRRIAYQTEADPLGMQYLRGEISKEEWIESIDSIKQRMPKVK